MRLSADTNVLVRAVVGDDAKQSKTARQLLREAEIAALPLSALCELVWALRAVYGYDCHQIADVIDRLVAGRNVMVNIPAVEAGLIFLRGGGDFADGVIAFEGESLGGDVFVSFDRKAVALRKKQGGEAELLA